MQLDNNAHSVFLLQYHLILVIKYRKNILNEEISERAKEIFEYIAPKYHISLEQWEYSKDFIHMQFRAHPNTEISKFINTYKSASSRLIKKEFPEILDKLWNQCFWSKSFYLLTTGAISMESINHYIESQKNKKE